MISKPITEAVARFGFGVGYYGQGLPKRGWVRVHPLSATEGDQFRMQFEFSS